MIEERLKQLLDLPQTYIGEAPVDVDNCQWIRASSGVSRVHFNKDTYDKPAYSIYVRGKNNQETKARTKEVYDSLKNYADASCAVLITRLPTFLGNDDKYRSVYTFRLEYQLGGY